MSKSKPPVETKVQVFRRDGWICHWCKRPLIFHLFLKLRQRQMRDLGHDVQFYQQQFKRSEAFLCDELAAVVDHVIPKKRGGRDTLDNLVASCNKCNGLKGDKTVAEWREDLRIREQIVLPDDVFGSERPTPHDGFSAAFVQLGKENPKWLLIDAEGKEVEEVDREWWSALRW